MENIYKNIYGQNMTEPRQPKKKHVFNKAVPITDKMDNRYIAQEERQERTALIDQNERLHELQMRLKRI